MFNSFVTWKKQIFHQSRICYYAKMILKSFLQFIRYPKEPAAISNMFVTKSLNSLFVILNMFVPKSLDSLLNLFVTWKKWNYYKTSGRYYVLRGSRKHYCRVLVPWCHIIVFFFNLFITNTITNTNLYWCTKYM